MDSPVIFSRSGASFAKPALSSACSGRSVRIVHGVLDSFLVAHSSRTRLALGDRCVPLWVWAERGYVSIRRLSRQGVWKTVLKS